MSKKILSIALAVVMLFSVLACTAGAANEDVSDTVYPGEGDCGLRVVTDAYVGMPAGEEVNVKVYWVHPAGFDFTKNQSVGNVCIAYNTAAYTYNTEFDGKTTAYDGRTWGAAYVDYLKPAALVNTTTNIINAMLGKVGDDQKSYGWNKGMLVQMTFDTNVTTNGVGCPIDPDCEIFTLSFTTNKKLEATDVIGIPSKTANSTTLTCYPKGSGSTKYNYNTVLSAGESDAEPLTVAVNETATAKMRPGTAAGTVDLGLTGTFMNKSFTIDTSGDPCGQKVKNMSAVGAQARVNGVVSAAEDIHIYETTDGYNFRIAIAGMDAAGLGAQIEVRTYITTDKGTFFSNWMNIDATTVHENAVANNMPGII